MKLLSILVAAGLLAHFWTDRIEYLPGEVATVLVNKWTGKHCSFYSIYQAQTDTRVNEELTVCRVTRSNGKVEFP